MSSGPVVRAEDLSAEELGLKSGHENEVNDANGCPYGNRSYIFVEHSRGENFNDSSFESSV
jgi:hypothetical protein